MLTPSENPFAAPQSKPFAMTRRRTIPDALRCILLLAIAAFSALPLAWLAVPYTFAFRAALFLGRWPYYGHPDPKNLPEHFHPHTEALEPLIPMILFVVQAGLFTFFIARFTPRARWLRCAAVTAASLWVFTFLLFVLDPAGAFEWIMD